MTWISEKSVRVPVFVKGSSLTRKSLRFLKDGATVLIFFSFLNETAFNHLVRGN